MVKSRLCNAKQAALGQNKLAGIFFVALGGAIGSVARYQVSLWASGKFGASFPYGTLIVNVAGCYLIGLFMIIATEKQLLPPYWRLLVASGFLGGLTTFSSFSYETLKLAQDGAWQAAIGNLAANVCAGLLATWGGIVTARFL